MLGISTCFDKKKNAFTFDVNISNLCISSTFGLPVKKIYKVMGCLETNVLQDPDEAVVEIGVDRLHIVQRDRFAKQLFVERQSEASVDVVAVEHRHAHYATHKVKV